MSGANPRLAADDPFADPFYVAPADEAEDEPEDEADTPAPTRPRRRANPATGNRRNPTNAPRFNGPAGINVFAATVATLAPKVLPPSAVSTWFALWRRADDHGRAHASVPALAAETNLSQKTVKRSTKRLAELGFLELIKRGSSVTHIPNLYRLHAMPDGGGLGTP
jgi:hypothetical protein